MGDYATNVNLTYFQEHKDEFGVEIRGTIGGTYLTNGHQRQGGVAVFTHKIRLANGRFAKGDGTLCTAVNVPTNPQTVFQQSRRGIFKSGIYHWAQLSSAERLVYVKKALKDPTRNGHNIFMSEWMNYNYRREEVGPPDYDSGWTAIAQGGSDTLTHSVGGDEDDYLIRMEGDDGDCGKTINDLGGTSGVGHFESGFYWCTLTNTEITINRGSSDTHAAKVRIRIWRYA